MPSNMMPADDWTIEMNIFIFTEYKEELYSCFIGKQKTKMQTGDKKG